MARGRPKGTNNITEDITTYNREYMRLYIKKQESIQCECGGKYKKSKMNNHLNTNKHQLYEFRKI